jgi:hypothetical protein
LINNKSVKKDVSTYSQRDELYLIEEMAYIISREFENLAEDLNYVSKEYKNADEMIKSSIGSRTIDMNLNTIGDSANSGENNASYFKRSLKQIVYGNYTDDVTLLGTGTQIGAGLLGIDLPADIRDVSADFVNWRWSWGHVKDTALDAAAFFPVLGGLKYTDEVATLAKNSDEIADSAKVLKNSNKIDEVAIEGIEDFNLTVKDIPTAKSDEFNNFFNSLTYDELNKLWNDKKIEKN